MASTVAKGALDKSKKATVSAPEKPYKAPTMKKKNTIDENDDDPIAKSLAERMKAGGLDAVIKPEGGKKVPPNKAVVSKPTKPTTSKGKDGSAEGVKPPSSARPSFAPGKKAKKDDDDDGPGWERWSSLGLLSRARPGPSCSGLNF